MDQLDVQVEMLEPMEENRSAKVVILRTVPLEDNLFGASNER